MQSWHTTPKPITFTPTTHLLYNSSSSSLNTKPNSSIHCFFIPLHDKTVHTDEQLLYLIQRCLQYAIYNQGPESRRARYGVCPVRSKDAPAPAPSGCAGGGVWICFCFPDSVAKKGERAMLIHAELCVGRELGIM